MKEPKIARSIEVVRKYGEGCNYYHVNINAENEVAGVVMSPNGNCQTYSIRFIGQLLEYDNFIDILKKIQEPIDKRQLLIDVKDYDRYVDKIDNLFSDKVILKSKYKNRTDNNMVIYLLNTEGI